MSRFYREMHAGPAADDRPLAVSSALVAAARWLRDLSSADAAAIVESGLLPDTARAHRDARVPAAALRAMPHDRRPFADPTYWAPFILMGE